MKPRNALNGRLRYTAARNGRAQEAGMEDFWTWFTVIVGGGSVLIAIGATIVGLLCTIVPFVAIGWYIYNQAKKRDAIRQSALGWRTTTGRVIKSRVEVTGGETASVSPKVTFAYDVNGRAYQSSQIKAGDTIMRVSTSENAYETVDRYPEGAIVQVYYNPANPEEAALER
jgi:hypothetical protein